MNRINLLSRLAFFGILLGFGGYKWYQYAFPPALPFENAAHISLEGRQLKLPEGKFVLVSYFQTWCKDCITELPHIQKLVERVGEDKLTVFLVSDEEDEKLTRFKNRWKVEFPMAKPGGKNFSDLGIKVFPTTYLLDPDGKVVLTKLEGYDWSNEEVTNIINKIKN